MKRAPVSGYTSIYERIGFEREGLFRLISDAYSVRTVLYPGCLTHITPSFFFQHVVYVDSSPAAAAFFRQENDVRTLIDSRKTYHTSSYFAYLNRDFRGPLPLRHNEYDLVISLFSGPLIAFSEQYLRPGGLLLTNSHFADGETAAALETCRPEKQIARIRGAYRFTGTDSTLRPKRASSLVRRGGGFVYEDREIYFLYRKISDTKQSRRSRR